VTYHLWYVKREELSHDLQGHDVVLAAFLVQAELPALALREVVVDLESERGTDAGERGKWEM
jgi:hypothetical protein